MKNKKINLHINRRRTLCYMVFFSLVAILINIVIGSAIYPYLAQLRSLLISNYEYSITTRNSIGSDDYYQYDAGICFSTIDNKDNSINADIVMQIENTNYSNNVSWNTDILEKYEVAVSEGIAKENKLSVGDSIISKHIVSGETHEYFIAKILPDQLATIVTATNIYNKGIIIMGYDDEYKSNISYSCLVFTNEDINELASYSPTNIVYRNSEISLIALKILPYLLVIMVISVLMTLIELFLNCNEIKANFIRLATLGVNRKELNHSYNRFLWSYGMASMMSGVGISCIVLSLVNYRIVAIFVACIVIVVEVTTLFISIVITNKRLWRK